jgi:hypothetical protein
MDIKVIDNDSLGFSLFGKHTQVNDGYRDIRQPKSDPFSATNRESVAFGGKLELDPLTFQLSTASAWDLNSETQSSTGAQRQGYDTTVSLDLYDVRSRFGDDAGAGGGLWSVLPGSVWIGYGQGNVSYATNKDAPADLTTDWNAGMSWNWDRGQASISYWHSSLDNRQPGAESADWVGDGVNLGLGLYRDAANFDAFLSFGRYDNQDPWSNSVEYDIGGGVSADVFLKKFPDISTSLYLGRFDGRYYAYEGTSLYDNWELEIAFDFSKYLAGNWWKDKPSLKLLYRINGAGSRENYSGASDNNRDVEHAVGVWFQTKLSPPRWK